MSDPKRAPYVHAGQVLTAASMTRRAFLRSVIIGTLAAPLVTRPRQKPCLCALLKFHGIPAVCDRHAKPIWNPHPKQVEFFESGPRISMRYQVGGWYRA